MAAGPGVGPRRVLLCGSGDGGVEVCDADDVVHGAGEQEPGPVSFSAEVTEFASSTDGFDPSEGFLNPFTYSLRHDMAGVTGRAAIDLLNDARSRSARRAE